MKTIIEDKQLKDNYTLPTCGLPLIWFAYPWFKFWYFIHLWFLLLLAVTHLVKINGKSVFLLKFYVSLLPKQKIAQKCKKKRSISGICLSLHSHKSWTWRTYSKKKKKTQINLYKITDLMKHLRKIIKL